MVASPPSSSKARAQAPLDPRIAQWFAVELIRDARARLVEGGAGGDTRIDLARVFVDLTATAHRGRETSDEDVSVVRAICAPSDDDRPRTNPRREHVGRAWASEGTLIIGGPGSGKTTATTMISQLLRLQQIRENTAAIPPELESRIRQIAGELDDLQRRLELTTCHDLLPLRVNLPEFASWLAGQDGGTSASLLWTFLARQATEHTAKHTPLELSGEDLANAVAHRALLWIFDGLDEVPRSAGRDRVVATIQAVSPSVTNARVVVTTRPQGYEGELGDLDVLSLAEMSRELALDYGKRLLRAWRGDDAPELDGLLDTLRSEFEKPDVQALVVTPLHATMAILLIAQQGKLPKARKLLFEHYFHTIFRRELNKPGDPGVSQEDSQLIEALHARAGLVLHVRSQSSAGARPLLSPRELRTLLEAIFRGEGKPPEDATITADRILRFAADRLVLLLRVADGGFAFGVRSLQEYFAAVALLQDGSTEQVARRLEHIAVLPHWANVMGLVVSGLALPGSGTTAKQAALRYTAGICRALNDGTLGGQAAAACFAGSRLAIAMLRETERFGNPWLHDPLWGIALEAAQSPVQTSAVYFASLHYTPFGSAPSPWNDQVEIHVRLGLLASQWSNAGHERWHRRVCDLARQALVQGGSAAAAGWRLLQGALLQRDPVAVQIATEHAPTTEEQALDLLWSPVGADIELAPWLKEFADNNLHLIPPSFLTEVPPYANSAAPSSNVFTRPTSGSEDRVEALDLLIGDDLACRLWPVDLASAIWTRATIPEVPASAEWRMWSTVARFHAAPSKDRLGDALEAVADAKPADFADAVAAIIAWPLHACLEFAGTADELRALASAARSSELGDLADWRAAETRWKAATSVPDEEITRWLCRRNLPWTRDVALQGWILPLRIAKEKSRTYTPAIHETKQVIHREIARACTIALQDLTNARRPLTWLNTMYRIAWGNTLSGVVLPFELITEAPDEPDAEPYALLFAVNLLLPNLKHCDGTSRERWIQLLNVRGQKGQNRSLHRYHGQLRGRLHSNTKELIAQLATDPDQWGLSDAIWAMVQVDPTIDLRNLRVPAPPVGAPSRARAHIAALTLLTGHVSETDVPALLAQLSAPAEGFDCRSKLLDVLQQRPSERATRLLLQLLDTAERDGQLKDEILGALFQQLKYAVSPVFNTASAWRQHDLPEPYLAGPSPEVPPTRIVELVEVSNLRLFKDTPHVSAPFPIPAPDVGQWIVLVGENGSGKTTLLRALALALAEPTVANRLLDENLPFIRNGGEGRVVVRLSSGTLGIAIRRDARTEVITPVESTAVLRPWVVGYGVRRGNARGEKDRAAEWGPTSELHTLFDRPATLVNAVDWLLELDRRVLNERRQYGDLPSDAGLRVHAATWRAVENALKSLLGITALLPEDRYLMVTHPTFGRVRLDALSDGYLTTTGWLIDLIARWVKWQEDLGEMIGPDLLRQMTGVVLLDEIDLHLHPMWQTRIIDEVRRLFPRLSFVVTTHNPLTLHGARAGEIYVMRRDEQGRVELNQRDIQPGHDVDRVLLEQFGILYTFDHETSNLLKQHRNMLQNGIPTTDPDRVQLEQALATRLGRVGEVLTDERSRESDPARPWSDEDRRLAERYRKPKP